jgi:hypothetical protein
MRLGRLDADIRGSRAPRSELARHRPSCVAHPRRREARSTMTSRLEIFALFIYQEDVTIFAEKEATPCQ